MPNIDKILKQLKNRKVFRSLVIYAGFAFVLLQICDIVIPRLFLPEWTMTLIIVLVIIGFPTTLVLSWIYDVTPAEDGEKPSTEAKQTLGVYALTGLVLTVIGIGFWVAVGMFDVSFSANDEVPSIAIIPFDNKGADDEDFYAYSISSELISNVASAGIIRVASMRDVEKLDYTTLDNNELSEKLLVRYITHGSIWKVDSIFQLSMELYDTKTAMILWAKSWQKDWDELASIKGDLAENILNTLGVSTKRDISIVPTNNADAYEYYLKAKYKYENIDLYKKENFKLTEQLLLEALRIDENLLIARELLGKTYMYYGNRDKAMISFTKNLDKAKDIPNISFEANSLKWLGKIYSANSNYEKGLEYLINSLEKYKLINDKLNIANVYNVIGHHYKDQNDIVNAQIYWEKGGLIHQELEDVNGIFSYLVHTADFHFSRGDYLNSLAFNEKAFNVIEKSDTKDAVLIFLSYLNLGEIYGKLGEYDKALDYYSKLINYDTMYNKYFRHLFYDDFGYILYKQNAYNESIKYLSLADSISNKCLLTKTNLYLSYKNLGKDYDVTKIHSLIKETDFNDYIEFELNYLLYQLLEDSSYLEIAYSQVQEKADNLEPDVAAKFLSYPIPAAIVEEWEKVN